MRISKTLLLLSAILNLIIPDILWAQVSLQDVMNKAVKKPEQEKKNQPSSTTHKSSQDQRSQSPAVSRFRALNKTNQTPTVNIQSPAPPLTGKQPGEPRLTVQKSQGSGHNRFDKLEDYTLSEDDLLNATDQDGMIDINKIPDLKDPKEPSGQICGWTGGTRIFGVPGYEVGGGIYCACNGKPASNSQCKGPKPQ